MRRMWRISFCCLFLTAAASADENAGSPDRGKAVYTRYCVACHGERGDGAGPSAPSMTPKPRDFRQGTFKWR
jgi:mono/diheme cytochrome c family protein